MNWASVVFVTDVLPFGLVLTLLPRRFSLGALLCLPFKIDEGQGDGVNAESPTGG